MNNQSTHACGANEQLSVNQLRIGSSFRERTEEALRNPFLRDKLRKAFDHAVAGRAGRIAELDSFQEMRDCAHAIKRHVLESLDEYLVKLVRAAQATGVTVFLAQDAAAARKYVVDLATERGCRLIAKSKSMVTEEIALAPAMAQAGFEVVETDLAEFILQLAGEMPSHLTSTAVHKSRQDIGRLFAQELGVGYTDDPRELVAIARERLRHVFISADMGISGANLLIAETGSVVIVENEGNARLVTSLPRVHVVVTGIEKIIPRLADLDLFLTLLLASAGGQTLPTYTSVITGPRREGEMGGPNELHLVLVDGGRSRLLSNPELREALACIRCGACLNVCPVYRRVGGHAYGWVYQGPIGKLLARDLWGVDYGWDLAFGSTLCGACAEVCPVRIDIPSLLLRLRQMAVEDGYGSDAERRAFRVWRWLMRHSRMCRFLSRYALRPVTKFFPGLVGSLAPGWMATRHLPQLAPHTFAQLWRKTGGFRLD